MPISKDDVKYIAKLARLSLTDEEVSNFQVQLESILEYIGKLKKADISGVLPMAHVLDIKNIYRPDTVRPSIDPEKVIKAAPSSEGRFFKVPKIIEG